MLEEVKCLVGTLCHFKLPRKVSSFVSAKDRLCDRNCIKSLTSPTPHPLFSVFVSTPLSGDKYELGFSVWMKFK